MPRLATILCPVDFSPATPQVARYAKDLARTLGARLVLLHVTRPLHRFTVLEVGLEDIRRFSKAIHEGAVRNMQALKGALFSDMEVSLRVEEGYPSETILAVAKECGADLIVLGTHGYSGLQRIVFGSVAEKVLKQSPIPVLTLRPDSATQPN